MRRPTKLNYIPIDEWNALPEETQQKLFVGGGSPIDYAVVTTEDKKAELRAENQRKPRYMTHIDVAEWAAMTDDQRRAAVQAYLGVVENHSKRVTLDLRVRALEERVKDLENKHGVS